MSTRPLSVKLNKDTHNSNEDKRHTVKDGMDRLRRSAYRVLVPQL